MKASWYALPLSLALAAAGPFAACSSDDDDDNGRVEAGSGGSGQGAGGTSQGAGGAGGGSGTGGAGAGGGTSQGGAGACGTEEAEVAAAPAVVQGVITDAKSKPEVSPQGDITRYDYNGAVVYYVPPPQMTADVKSQLFGKDGTLICEPDGGAVPVPDPKCPDFATAKSNPCIVWVNPRKPKLSQRAPIAAAMTRRSSSPISK